MADPTHSPALTKEVAEAIRDFLKEDEEGELDPYDQVDTKGQNASFKMNNLDNDLLYLVTITPVED